MTVRVSLNPTRSWVKDRMLGFAGHRIGHTYELMSSAIQDHKHTSKLSYDILNGILYTCFGLSLHVMCY